MELVVLQALGAQQACREGQEELPAWEALGAYPVALVVLQALEALEAYREGPEGLGPEA